MITTQCHALHTAHLRNGEFFEWGVMQCLAGYYHIIQLHILDENKEMAVK